MATSFDLVPPGRRRPTLVHWPLGLLAGTMTLLLTTMIVLRADVAEVNTRYEALRAASQERLAALERQILAERPDAVVLADITAAISAHNRRLGGPRRDFTRFFLELARCLPAAAVIAALDSPGTGRALLTPSDPRLRLSVVVADQGAALAFYQALSACPLFSAVGMTPRGQVTHQGRAGLAVEVTLDLVPPGSGA